MPYTGEISGFHLCATSFLYSGLHILCSLRRNRSVDFTMERPNSDIYKFVCHARYSGTAKRHSRREIFGMTCYKLPCAVSAHRNSRRIYTGKIYFTGVKKIFKKTYCRSKSHSRFFRKLARACCPFVIYGNPFIFYVAGALRSYYNTIVTLDRKIYKTVFAMKNSYLQFVFRTAFSVTVKEKEHGIFLPIVRIIIRGKICSVRQGEKFICLLIFINICRS